METILAKFTLLHTRSDADPRQAKALASHRGDALGSHVRGEEDVGVEAFGQQLVFQIGVIGVVPEVVVFPGIVFQVEQFSHPFAMVDTKLVLSGAVHGGESSASTGEVWVEGIKVFTANEFAVVRAI